MGAIGFGPVQAPLLGFARGARSSTVYRMWPRKSALERRVDAMMERVHQAGDDHVQLVAVLEEYLRLAHAEGVGKEGFFFDTGAFSQTLADSTWRWGGWTTRSGSSPTRPGADRARAPRCCVRSGRN